MFVRREETSKYLQSVFNYMHPVFARWRENHNCSYQMNGYATTVYDNAINKNLYFVSISLQTKIFPDI